MASHNFRQLKICKEGIKLVKSVYTLTYKFPSDERFNLTSQLRRCAVSIPSNIAEGTSRSSNKAFSHFLEISLGSLFELETQLILSHELEFLNNESFLEIEKKIIELQKMIMGFSKTLSN
jgi:four helix bundle protein